MSTLETHVEPNVGGAAGRVVFANAFKIASVGIWASVSATGAVRVDTVLPASLSVGTKVNPEFKTTARMVPAPLSSPRQNAPVRSAATAAAIARQAIKDFLRRTPPPPEVVNRLSFSIRREGGDWVGSLDLFPSDSDPEGDLANEQHSHSSTELIVVRVDRRNGESEVSQVAKRLPW